MGGYDRVWRQHNDLAMFEYAAVKVAMGNGSEKIKALADHITQDIVPLWNQKRTGISEADINTKNLGSDESQAFAYIEPDCHGKGA